MKPLNLEETRLKEEMKSRCLNKGQYTDENAKAKFDMLCHLEDFEVQYWNLKEEKKEWIDLLNMFKNQQKEFIEYMEDKIYSIEPKGTGIIYNCEYDSEEYFISAMKEQSRLNTLKEDLSKYKKIIGGVSNE